MYNYGRAWGPWHFVLRRPDSAKIRTVCFLRMGVGQRKFWIFPPPPLCLIRPLRSRPCMCMPAFRSLPRAHLCKAPLRDIPSTSIVMVIHTNSSTRFAPGTSPCAATRPKGSAPACDQSVRLCCDSRRHSKLVEQSRERWARPLPALPAQRRPPWGRRGGIGNVAQK